MLYIDTRGTFTDCQAISPGGNTQKFKVLSSSELKGGLVGQISPNQLAFNHKLPFQSDILDGYQLKTAPTNDAITSYTSSPNNGVSHLYLYPIKLNFP